MASRCPQMHVDVKQREKSACQEDKAGCFKAFTMLFTLVLEDLKFWKKKYKFPSGIQRLLDWFQVPQHWWCSDEYRKVDRIPRYCLYRATHPGWQYHCTSQEEKSEGKKLFSPHNWERCVDFQTKHVDFSMQTKEKYLKPGKKKLDFWSYGFIRNNLWEGEIRADHVGMFLRCFQFNTLILSSKTTEL